MLLFCLLFSFRINWVKNEKKKCHLRGVGGGGSDANCQRYQIILKPLEGGRRRDFENAHQMAGKLWWGIAHFFSEWASNFWRMRRRETEVLVGRWLLILPSCSMRSVGGILRFHIMKVDMCEKDFFRIAMLWSHFEPEAEKPPVVLFHKTYPQFDWGSMW